MNIKQTLGQRKETLLVKDRGRRCDTGLIGLLARPAQTVCPEQEFLDKVTVSITLARPMDQAEAAGKAAFPARQHGNGGTLR